MSRPSSQLPETQDYFCSTKENIRQVRPFYWMLLLVLAVLYAVSLAGSPALRVPLRLIPFTVLMLAHAGLHWIGPYLTTRRRWLLPYFVLQGALVVAVTWLAPSQRLLAGLYLALIAVATGVIEDVRLSAVVVTGYLTLSAVSFAALWGWNSIPDWLILVTPMAFFMMVYVTTFIRQAQARMHAVNLLSELETAHRQLAEYAEKVESLTLTTERQRMARELHDTLAQGLAGLILQLEALEGYLGQGDSATAVLIATQAQDRARAALSDARQAIDDLRLRPAPTESLLQAIREEAQRFSSATGIPCAITLPPNLALPASMAEHALRCITEGLTNIARHARASHASVSIAIHDGSATIQVQDNGTGFDPSAVAEQAGHYGLLGLRERARCGDDAVAMPAHAERRTGRMSKPIRVLIADDHLVVREGLRLILGISKEFELVGEAGDGATAIRLVGELKPDVVLMDLRMPGMGGLEAIERIHAEWPQVAVVILTTYNEDDLMIRGLRAGARGYLLKDTSREALLDAVHAAARGETLLQPDIMTRVLSHVESAPPHAQPRGEIELTEREIEVLTAVARGERNKEIAARLNIAERTVKAYLDSIYNKLGVDSRAAAVSLATQRGILPRNEA